MIDTHDRRRGSGNKSDNAVAAGVSCPRKIAITTQPGSMNSAKKHIEFRPGAMVGERFTQHFPLIRFEKILKIQMAAFDMQPRRRDGLLE